MLSQTGNTANGPFGAGFTRAGQINYTGLEFVGMPDMFWDGTPSKRTDFWAVDILNADSAGPIPEPATFLILGTGLIALRYLPRRMRRSQISASRNNPQLLTGLHKEIKFNVRTSVQSHAASDTCAYGSTPNGMVGFGPPGRGRIREQLIGYNNQEPL